MFVLGVSKRTSGDFKPKDSDNVVSYDFVKLHVRYTFGVDADAPELAAGDAVDIIKVPSGVWKKFLDSAGLTVPDVLGTELSLLYNKYGKVSGISVAS